MSWCSVESVRGLFGCVETVAFVEMNCKLISNIEKWKQTEPAYLHWQECLDLIHLGKHEQKLQTTHFHTHKTNSRCFILCVIYISIELKFWKAVPGAFSASCTQYDHIFRCTYTSFYTPPNTSILQISSHLSPRLRNMCFPFWEHNEIARDES